MDTYGGYARHGGGAFSGKNPTKVDRSACYMARWLSVLLLRPLAQVIPVSGVLTLLLSGILYTAGGVMYALKWPLRDAPRFGFHEVFHVFILLGSIVFYLFLLQYIFPLQTGTQTLADRHIVLSALRGFSKSECFT